MIHLTYSNRTEALFERFARDLEAHRKTAASALDPVRLVVPSRQVDVWLRRALARRDGIAANLDSLFLRRFIAGLLERAEPRVRLVDSKPTLDAVLGLLLDDRALTGPFLEPVRAYLGGGGSGRDALDLRRVQLATELSRLFEEYAYSRPQMLKSWAQGKRVLEGPAAEIEAWQSELWRAALGPQSRIEGLRLHEVPEQLDCLDLAGAGPVFLFGVSYVAGLYQVILSRLARRAELHVYTLNPCLEFWEDVPNPRQAPRPDRLPRRSERVGLEAVLESEDPFGLTHEGDSPPLVLWGRPGRENIRLLNELSACDFHDAFEDPLDGGMSLLRQLQRDILVREPERQAPDPAFRFAGDRSLQFLACPNPQREAEAIASEVVALVTEDDARRGPGPRLSFSDIAVLVAGPDPGTLFAHLKAAFTQRSFQVPFTLDEGAGGGQSPIAEAAELLLRLPLGAFERSEVLRLITHPAVIGRFPEVDPAEWIGWCDRLGIFRGSSREDLAGSYVDRDLHNWDQGLRRLALGSAMTGLKSGDSRELELGDQRYLVEEHGDRVEGSAARFGLLVRSLLADARYARAAEHTAREWSELLSLMLETYLAPRGQEAERDRDRCLQAVRGRLGGLELGGQKVGFRVASELARAALSGLSARRSGQVGVTVSTMQPMRALPFRAIFVAGLAEGRFPAPAPRNTLDLRLARPQPGDVSAREQDQYLFLETLLCARERLYLSYVARNELTGDPLEASALVNELQRLVRRGYLPWEGRNPLLREVRLRRFDEELFPDLFGKRLLAFPTPPEARIEAQLLGLRRQLEGRGLTRLNPETLRRALPETVWPRVEEKLMLARPPKAGRLFRTDAPLRLSLAGLRKFLECPLQEGARTLLRLAEEEEDLAGQDDEPFEADRRQASSLQKECFEALVRAPGSKPEPGALFDELARVRLAAGKLPAGLFAELEREEHLRLVTGWEKAFLEHLKKEGLPPARPEVARFGGASEREEVDLLLDPLLLELDGELLGVEGPVRVALHGRTGLLLGGRTQSLGVRTRSKKGPERIEEAYGAQESLSGFLDHVALSAAGHQAERTAVVLLACHGEAIISRLTRFRALEAEEARSLLKSLAAALLSRVHDYLLPASAVFCSRSTKAPFAACVEEVMEKRACASLYGPIPNPEEFEAPPEREAHRLIDERFGLYFRSLAAEGAGEEKPKKEPTAHKPRRRGKPGAEGGPV